MSRFYAEVHSIGALLIASPLRLYIVFPSSALKFIFGSEPFVRVVFVSGRYFVAVHLLSCPPLLLYPLEIMLIRLMSWP